MNFDQHSTNSVTPQRVNTQTYLDPLDDDIKNEEVPTDSFEDILEELGDDKDKIVDPQNLDTTIQAQNLTPNTTAGSMQLDDEEEEEENHDQSQVSNVAKTLLVIGPLFLLACLGISFYMLNKSPESLETFFIGK